MLIAMSLKGKQKATRAAPTKKPLIRIAVVESDPLRFAGFQALFDSEPDFELISASLPDIGAQQNIDLVLLGNCHNLLDVMSCLKAPRPQLRIIVTGSGMDEQTILKAIAEGAKGYGLRSRRGDWQRSGLPQGSRVRGLAGGHFPAHRS